MPSISRYFWPCLEVICQSINDRKKITYAQLADKLELGHPQQEWSTVLDLIAGKTRREVGDDLTWNVVYTTGPAKGLGRYFSNDKTPGSTLLNPKDQKQVADYERYWRSI